MQSRVLVVKNISREGPGLLKNVFEANDIHADVVEASKPLPKLDDYGALVVLGGPASANDETTVMTNEIALVASALEAKIPVLGICLGHQVLARAAGATVAQAVVKEAGFFDERDHPYSVTLTDEGREDALFRGVDDEFNVFQLHGEIVEADDMDTAVVLAKSDLGQCQAIRVGHNAYGLQMHIEVTSAMLGVWAREDADLDKYEPEELQAQLDAFADDYTRTGRRILTNFCQIAGLTHV